MNRGWNKLVRSVPLSPRGTSGERAGERGHWEDAPPLPDPLLHFVEEREKCQTLGFRGTNRGFLTLESLLPMNRGWNKLVRSVPLSPRGTSGERAGERGEWGD